MRHMQHVTNEALNVTREKLGATESQREQLHQEITGLREQTARLSETITRLNTDLTEWKNESQHRSEKIDQLEREIRAMHATRSWRWTGWLRSIGRALGGRKP